MKDKVIIHSDFDDVTIPEKELTPFENEETAALEILEKNIIPRSTAMDDFIANFTMSKEELDKMEAEEINVIDGVLFEGQVASIVARPNGGKTLLAKTWAIDMTKRGYRVFYIFEDADLKGYKSMADTAAEHGFIVAASFTHVGQTAQSILAGMKAMVEEGTSLNKTVFILDTLKKFTEVLNKGENKKFYSLLRELTHKGAAFLLLAHANKYLDDNGDLMYEGTGDTLADVDAMYYLQDDGNKHAEVERFATLVYEKGRAITATKKVSYRFDIKTYMAEKLNDVLDTKKMAVQHQLQEHRKDEIAAVISMLSNNECSQKDLVSMMGEETGISREKAIILLRTLDGVLWTATSGGDRKHKKVYTLKGAEPETIIYEMEEI